MLNKLFRSDLAIELMDEVNDSDKIKKYNVGDIHITDIMVDDKISKVINKRKGIYKTIEFDMIDDTLVYVVVKELRNILSLRKITDKMSCLVIGLGNDKSTPDAIGPLVNEGVMITRAFYINDKHYNDKRIVAKVTPNVTGITGIETGEVVKGIVDNIKPDFLIVIDALASSSISRVNKTIQMTDTGIEPGSGANNKRTEISEDLYHIPVIAIGVPTVVDVVIVVNDTINYMFKHFSYLKNNLDLSKLSFKHSNINDDLLSVEEKKKLLGVMGELSDNDKLMLLREVVSSYNYDLMVTVKEIDDLVIKISEILAKVINQVLYDN